MQYTQRMQATLIIFMRLQLLNSDMYILLLPGEHILLNTKYEGTGTGTRYNTKY